MRAMAEDLHRETERGEMGFKRIKDQVGTLRLFRYSDFNHQIADPIRNFSAALYSIKLNKALDSVNSINSMPIELGV